jgi:histidine ammonia-lyase
MGVEKLAKTADICVAMNLEAIRGEVGAFDRRLHELGRPYPNQVVSAENIRRIIEGSEFTTEKARIAYGGDHGPRCQDAISIRAVPQTHGGVRDTIDWLKKNLEGEINFCSHRINPVLGYSADLMTIALKDLGNISERRSFRLTDSGLTYGLPMNLVGENPGFNHGFPVIQAAATAALGELKLLAMPCAAYSTIDPESREYICMTYDSTLKAAEVLMLLNKILAIEMLMAAQGMDLVKDRLSDFKFGAGSEAALYEFRKHVRVTRANRFAAPDMVESDRLVAEGTILAAVERAIGKLN